MFVCIWICLSPLVRKTFSDIIYNKQVNENHWVSSDICNEHSSSLLDSILLTFKCRMLPSSPPQSISTFWSCFFFSTENEQPSKCYRNSKIFLNNYFVWFFVELKERWLVADDVRCQIERTVDKRDSYKKISIRLKVFFRMKIIFVFLIQRGVCLTKECRVFQSIRFSSSERKLKFEKLYWLKINIWLKSNSMTTTQQKKTRENLCSLTLFVNVERFRMRKASMRLWRIELILSVICSEP